MITMETLTEEDLQSHLGDSVNIHISGVVAGISGFNQELVNLLEDADGEVTFTGRLKYGEYLIRNFKSLLACHREGLYVAVDGVAPNYRAHRAMRQEASRPDLIVCEGRTVSLLLTMPEVYAINGGEKLSFPGTAPEAAEQFKISEAIERKPLDKENTEKLNLIRRLEVGDWVQKGYLPAVDERQAVLQLSGGSNISASTFPGSYELLDMLRRLTEKKM